MSRAFRDTFKQTICLCENIVRRQSNSFAEVTITKHRKRHLNQSIACETIATYKCPNGDQTSLTPIIKSLSDKKKKGTSTTLKFSNSTSS
jgi:hypothetical protein